MRQGRTSRARSAGRAPLRCGWAPARRFSSATNASRYFIIFCSGRTSRLLATGPRGSSFDQRLRQQTIPPTTDCLYGMSALKQIALTINIALRRDTATLEYYRSASPPAPRNPRSVGTKGVPDHPALRAGPTRLGASNNGLGEGERGGARIYRIASMPLRRMTLSSTSAGPVGRFISRSN
jgi:hypothetical protein